MRQSMENILYGLKEIKELKPKTLRTFGFSSEEIVEIADEEWEMDEILNKEKKEWQEMQKTKKERENIFLEDGALTKEKIFEMRRRYLRGLYEKICYSLCEAELSGEPIERLKAEKNRIKFEYEVFTFQPDYNKNNKNGITDEEIEKAEARDISDFIDIGVRGFIICPFHKEKTASMHIFKNKFYCFGCGEKGRTINFMMKFYNLNFKEAVKKINNI